MIQISQIYCDSSPSKTKLVGKDFLEKIKYIYVFIKLLPFVNLALITGFFCTEEKQNATGEGTKGTNICVVSCFWSCAHPILTGKPVCLLNYTALSLFVLTK